MARTYGYARVSTAEQYEDRQLNELEAFGLSKGNIYVDKVSGKDFLRPAYQRLRRRIREGDLLVVSSIDRLGRSYPDIQEEWRFLTKEKNADILVLDMPLLDTRRDKDLMGTLIADIVLQLLSYVAQVEREHIRQRQADGILAARQRGVRFGRRPLPIPEGFFGIYEDWRLKRITTGEAMRRARMSSRQFYWMARKCRALEEGAAGETGEE